MNATNKFIFIKENGYNHEKIFSLLKNDKIKILKSLNEFLTILKKSISLTKRTTKNDELEVLKMVFHDILNLSEYYGASLLFEFVLAFKQETDSTKKMKLLFQIDDEQKKVYAYYSQLEQALNSSKQLRL